MFRIATLMETGGNFLEVHIQRGGFEKKEEAKSNARNTTDKTSRGRGSICFYDEREPEEILNDFVRTYPTIHWKYDNEESFIAEYSQGITIIPWAFVTYFSDNRPGRQ